MILLRRIVVGLVVLLMASCVMPIASPASSPASSPTPPQATTSALSALPPAGLPNGVAAGDVTQESVVLWARGATVGVITFTVQLDAATNVPAVFHASETLTRTVVEPLLPVTVTVSNLSPAARYRYTATVETGDSAAGTFRTPAADGIHAGLRFAATGDVRGGLAPFPAINNAPSRDLDFFVNLGDTVYADVASPAVDKQAQTVEEFRLKHNEVHTTRFELNSLAALRAATASFATIDDHEILNNFAGGTPASSSRYFAETTGLINETRLYSAGLDAFFAFQPIHCERYGAEADVRMRGRPKIYRYRTFGADAAIFVLDMRSFRDEPLPSVTNLDNDATIARFAQAAFAPERTVLGADQLADLQRDLLDAQQRGITWKFIVAPDPIQQIDMTSAADRWQGYAAERTRLLRFLEEEKISNVVFITADIHGTVANNLTYQEEAGGEQIPVSAWEIAVGPVAAYPPFAIAMYLAYVELGLVTEEQDAEYRSLPVHYDADDLPDDRDDYVKMLINEQMARWGHNPLGLEEFEDDEGPVRVTLRQGDDMVGHAYGWTEFAIDANSQVLTVTTYGIPAYVAGQMERDYAMWVARVPAVVSEFMVQPQP